MDTQQKDTFEAILYLGSYVVIAIGIFFSTAEQKSSFDKTKKISFFERFEQTLFWPILFLFYSLQKSSKYFGGEDENDEKNNKDKTDSKNNNSSKSGGMGI